MLYVTQALDGIIRKLDKDGCPSTHDTHVSYSPVTIYVVANFFHDYVLGIFQLPSSTVLSEILRKLVYFDKISIIE